MQQIILPQNEATPSLTAWQAEGRPHQVRQLYDLFFTIYPTSYSLDKLPLDTSKRAPLNQIKELCHTLFAAVGQSHGCGQHLNWAIHAIYYGIVKLNANRKMQSFHQKSAQDDAGHQAFMETIKNEVQTQIKALAPLFDNASHLLHLMLEEQANNPLLLRLLIEKESLSQKLWGCSTVELFNTMFPYQPESGYSQAGKSYFMSHWLEQALSAYEKSLEMNNTLSESRKQTYLIRAMIKDRDMENR